ncbi:MAG: hypothetical protein WAT78_11000 [Rhizobiaceae bacterium]
MSDLPAILVVDDEIRSQEAIRRILSEEFDVHVAVDGPDSVNVQLIVRSFDRCMACTVH